MSIIIKIKPEAEAELTRQAKVHGVRPEASRQRYFRKPSITERRKNSLPTRSNARCRSLRNSRTRSLCCRKKHSLREGLYQDHD